MTKTVCQQDNNEDDINEWRHAARLTGDVIKLWNIFWRVL